MEEYNLKMIVFVLANYGFEKCLKVHNEVHENGEGSISSFDKHIGDDQGSSYYYNDSLHIGDYCCQAIDYIKEKNLKKND